MALPSQNFPGIGGTTEIYKNMPERNAKYLNSVYTGAEELFVKLSKLVDSLRPWTVLAYIDVEGMVETVLKSVDDWEYNVKNLRLKRRELEKLPDTHRIDCFGINLISFKSNVDDLM